MKRKLETFIDHDSPVETILKRGWHISPWNWALLTLFKDPMFRWVRAEDRNRAVQMALNTGIMEARQLRQTYGELDVKEITTVMGVKVDYVDGNISGSYVYFSEYHNKTSTITICQSTIEVIKMVVTQNGLQDYVDPGTVENILIAHELFHHLENINPQIGTRTLKVKTWKVGYLQASAHLIMAGEIGAFAFTQELLSLDYFPRVLELLFLCHKNKGAAQKLLMDLVKWELLSEEQVLNTQCTTEGGN